MAKRHHDALAIQAGACNPSGIALSIVEACREARAEPDHMGTAALCADPAIRLMVHQLAFLCRTSDVDNGHDETGVSVYTKLTRECESAINPKESN